MFPFKNLRTNIPWLDRASKWIDDGLELVADGSRVSIKNGADEVGEIVDELLHVKYVNYGGDVVTHSTKTTTLIGKFDDVVDGGGTSAIKASKLFKYGENPGGVNLLNDPQWTESINVGWLSDAIVRNDIIRVVSNPSNVKNIWIDGIVGGTRSTYGKEVKLLLDSDYLFDPVKFVFAK